jgi:hypothetical protein
MQSRRASRFLFFLPAILFLSSCEDPRWMQSIDYAQVDSLYRFASEKGISFYGEGYYVDGTDGNGGPGPVRLHWHEGVIPDTGNFPKAVTVQQYGSVFERSQARFISFSADKKASLWDISYNYELNCTEGLLVIHTDPLVSEEEEALRVMEESFAMDPERNRIKRLRCIKPGYFWFSDFERRDDLSDVIMNRS